MKLIMVFILLSCSATKVRKAGDDGSYIIICTNISKCYEEALDQCDYKKYDILDSSKETIVDEDTTYLQHTLKVKCQQS